MSAEKAMSVREAASALGASLQQVYKLVWDGKLSSHKIDGQWHISNATVQSRLDKKAGAK
jgi:excisionase family DNA binding protein